MYTGVEIDQICCLNISFQIFTGNFKKKSVYHWGQGQEWGGFEENRVKPESIQVFRVSTWRSSYMSHQGMLQLKERAMG